MYLKDCKQFNASIKICNEETQRMSLSKFIVLVQMGIAIIPNL